MLHCILQSLTQLGARLTGAMKILSSVQEVGGGGEGGK